MGSTKTQTQQQQTSQQQNVYNPTQDKQVTDFRNSLYPQIGGMFAQANQPVYGQAQYASQLSNLNDLANSSIKSLQGRIAGSGGNLNGGGFGAGVEGILQNRNNQASAYSMQVPALNQQARLQSNLAVGGLANSVAGPALTTSTSLGTGNSTMDSTVTQSQSPLGIISSLLGAAVGGVTGGLSGGASSLFKGLLGGLGGAASSTPTISQGGPFYGPSMQQGGFSPSYTNGGGYNPNTQGGYNNMYNPFSGGGFA